MGQSLKLKIPSILDNVTIVESFIEHAKDIYQFNDDIYGNILVAVTESVNNAIVHGNKEDRNKMVQVAIDMNDKELSFLVQDEGTGFDYKKLPDPTAPENLENPGGRGIYLMRHLADEIEFSKQGNEVKMTFYLTT